MSLRELHKCRLCTTVRFQRFTPLAVIAYTNACVNDECLQRGPRCVPGDVLIIAERGNTEDKQFQIPKLSLSCIFIELHLCLKSLKTYLTMLNIFDLLLSLMQTDNYVYFLLPIDICAVIFFMNVPDNIKAQSVPTRTLCNCSLVSNLSLWYLYLLSDLHWGFWLDRQEK